MPRLTSAVLAMSHEVVKVEVPTGLNWNEHSAGSAVTTTGARGDRLLEGRVGVVGDAP